MDAIKDLLTPLLASHNGVLQKLQKAGANLVVVGGAVRDALLGIPPKDLDIEVYNLTPQDLEKCLPKLSLVGKSFGVYALPGLELSLPRLERKIAPGHQGFEVMVDPSLSFNKAAQRRDLTINSLGFEIATNKLLDPYGGLQDLQNQTLRAVAPETFVEDPLRVLRVAVFAARFSMTISPELRGLCKDLDLEELSWERIQGEFEKLLKAPLPALGILFLENIGALEKLSLEPMAHEKVLGFLDKPSLDLETRLAGLLLLCPESVQLLFGANILKRPQKLAQGLKTLKILLEGPSSRSDWCFFLEHLRKNKIILPEVEKVYDDIFAEKSFAEKGLKKYGLHPKSDTTPLLTGARLKEHGITPGPIFSNLLKKAQELQYKKNILDVDNLLKTLLS